MTKLSSVLATSMEINPKELGDYLEIIAVRDMLIYMHENAQTGLFDGTLELMDANIIAGLGARLDAISLQGVERSAPGCSFSDIERLHESHEIQEFAAALFNHAYHPERSRSEFDASIGPEIAGDLSAVIDDWKCRYQAEEGSDPAV